MPRPGQEPPEPHPEWMRLERAEGDEIIALLPGVLATVIPRPRGAYNDLALPIKLFEYLAYGRPLLVTDCTEQARIVREADAGIVVGDSVDAVADGLRRLATATPEELDDWSARATDAARAASWEHRARHIVDVIMEGTMSTSIPSSAPSVGHRPAAWSPDLTGRGGMDRDPGAVGRHRDPRGAVLATGVRRGGPVAVLVAVGYAAWRWPLPTLVGAALATLADPEITPRVLPGGFETGPIGISEPMLAVAGAVIAVEAIRRGTLSGRCATR